MTPRGVFPTCGSTHFRFFNRPFGIAPRGRLAASSAEVLIPCRERARIHDHQLLFLRYSRANVSSLLRKDHDIWFAQAAVPPGLQDWSFPPDAAYSGADVAVAPLSLAGNTGLDPLRSLGQIQLRLRTT